MQKLMLTDEQQRALDEHQGFVRGAGYVLMSIDVFRKAVGVDDECEQQATLSAINEAIDQLEAGKGVPLEEFQHRLKAKHGLPH